MSYSRSVGRNTFQIHNNPNHKPLNSMGNTHNSNMTKDAKRQKLKEILIEKFTKKFGIKNSLPFLNEEISSFLCENNLTELDLKKLEDRIGKILLEMRDQETLRNNLSTEENKNSYRNNFKDTEHNNQNTPNNYSHNYHSNNNNQNILKQKSSKSVSDCVLPELNNNLHINNPNSDVVSVKSKFSRMSGASHLSRFDEDNAKVKLNQMAEMEFLKKKEPKPERFDFAEHGDEWNAIVKYNQHLHKEDKINNKRKDLEVKRRIREDLDNQVRMKYKRKHEEKLKDKEFDKVLLDHCDYLSELDRKRQEEYKEKVMKDKENRDKQLIDEKKKKRKEIIKEKKYDREVVKNIKEELEKEKERNRQKRINEVEMLHQTLRENEINRIKKMENLKKEKYDDVKAIEENNKVMERQENERREYFKKIERNGNNFVSTNANFVLSDLKKNSKEEEEKMKLFMEEKEKRYLDIY